MWSGFSRIKIFQSWMAYATTRAHHFALVLTALTFLVSLLSTFFVWHTMAKGFQETVDARFQAVVQEVHERVQQRMRAYEQVLRGGQALFLTNGEVSRSQWARYVDSIRIDDFFPGVQGMGYAVRLKASELPEYIAKVRAEGFPSFTVHPKTPLRNEYTSIIYLEPFTPRNQRAFGYDMASEPTRREAMEKARDSGQTVISGRVKLLQETDKNIQAGFLMYLPVYSTGARPEALSARRERLQGYVYAPFRMNDLMRGVLGAVDKDVALEIYDGPTLDKNQLMFSDYAGELKNPIFQHQGLLEVQGRTWSLAVRSLPEFEEQLKDSRLIFIWLLGVLASVLFSSVVWMLATRREQALVLAEEMSKTAREQGAFIHAVVESAASGIVTLNEDGVICSFNRAAEHIFAYTSDEAVGLSILELLPESERQTVGQALLAYLHQTMTNTAKFNQELKGRRKNGDAFVMDWAVSEAHHDSARVFVVIVRDITERTEAQEALRRSEERFELAFMGSNDGLWDWDITSNCVYYSPVWKAMLGYAETELSNTMAEWTNRVHPDDLAGVMGAVRIYLSSHEQSYRYEHRIRHRDGHYLWVLVRGFAQRDEKGRAYRMVGINTDIDERKKVERLKSEFVATVSHELRTPLTSIRGALKMVVSGVTGALPEKAQSLLVLAERNSERLLALINDILDMEKIQSGQLTLQCTVQDIRPFLEQSIEANQSYADLYQVQFQLHMDEQPLYVRVDSGRLLQVLANLLSNAAKFSHAGGRVEIAAIVSEMTVEIRVKDYGEGIPVEFHGRIFQKFTQADSSASRQKGGTGLGLAITRSIVEAMDGSIRFESTLGQGTCFIVTLPRAPFEAEADQ